MVIGIFIQLITTIYLNYRLNKLKKTLKWQLHIFNITPT